MGVRNVRVASAALTTIVLLAAAVFTTLVTLALRG